MDGEWMRPPLPEAFVKRVGEQLGEELLSFLQCMDAPALRGIRMNPMRMGGEAPFRDAERKIPWAADGWELQADSLAGTTIAHEAGAFYLQEPAAMMPAAVMRARPGEKILDLCAAPGGKSTQMGLDMRGEGLLICNEPVPKRAAILSRNIERMGIPHSIVTCAYPEKLAQRWQNGFDGVLVDAPCSGEGMFRREPETRGEWTAEKAAGCALRQRKILDAAAEMVRPGGRLVYATCTWNPEENEKQVSAFLTRHPEFEMAPFSLPEMEAREGYFTCWVHRTRGEGQFAALLRRRGEQEAALPDGRRDFPVKKEDFRAWQACGLSTRTPNAALGQTLCWVPEIPDLRGIQVMRMGMHVGQVRGNRLIPDHAAALDILPPPVQQVALADQEALAYLAGEAVPGEASGWLLATWRGLVLGWGKGSDGMIKNHYPKGLRNGRLTV